MNFLSVLSEYSEIITRQLNTLRRVAPSLEARSGAPFTLTLTLRKMTKVNNSFVVYGLLVRNGERKRFMKINAFIKRHILITVYVIVYVTVFFAAAYGYYYKSVGEIGVSAHLFLTITGAPFSLISWFLTHGSLKAIFVAGIMGVLQWYLFAKLVAFAERRR